MSVILRKIVLYYNDTEVNFPQPLPQKTRDIMSLQHGRINSSPKVCNYLAKVIFLDTSKEARTPATTFLEKGTTHVKSAPQKFDFL